MTNETYTIVYYLLPLIGLIITLIAQGLISVNYNKYRQISINKNIKGYQVARKILDDNGLSNVKVESVSGNLTDHYDPTAKVVRLSYDIYEGVTIASSAVAAHECGHAIQDKIGYQPMTIRSKLVPVVNLSTKIGYIIIIIGITLGALNLATIGIILLSAMLLFQLITLPVEFDASRRGKKELTKLNILSPEETKESAKMLLAAALTYVASVLTTLLQILRFALMIAARRNRR